MGDRLYSMWDFSYIKMMNKRTALSEIAIYYQKRLNTSIIQTAYANCPHQGKCFKLCGQGKKCINPGVIAWWWHQMALAN